MKIFILLLKWFSKNPMPTPLIAVLCFVSVLLVGCATDKKTEDNMVVRSSMLERIPIVYRQDIQQGNVIDQNMLNQLRPGLSKRQVRFIMGTPLLVDVFHQSRWDYVYTITHGWGKMERKRVQLYFDQDTLQRIEGDMTPQSEDTMQVTNEETVVSVPDYLDPNRGVIKKAVESISDAFTSTPDPNPPPVTSTTDQN